MSKATSAKQTEETIDQTRLSDLIREAKEQTEQMIREGRFREAHARSTQAQLTQAQKWIRKAWQSRKDKFADGSEVDPARINPQLIPVVTKEHQDLFRLARYHWSMPYSKGYGRRLRFLIIDQSNDKLIGILGLQSAPIDFAPRDSRIDYPQGRKTEMVNQTMDAFTLGAVPPYNRLLGGKLIVCAAASREIADAYREKYACVTTLIASRNLPAELALITTTSAFGRSSIYNRVFYHDDVKRRLLCQPLGNTKGYGTFHLQGVYPEIKKFLLQIGHADVNNGFGKGRSTGPKPVTKNVSRTLGILGIPHRSLQHGIPRPAYAIPLCRNPWDYLSGNDAAPDYYDTPFATLAQYWKQRWLLPRAERITDWRKWQKSELYDSITTTQPPML